MLFILVGSRTTCSSPKSFVISIACFDKPAATILGLVFRRSQSMSGRLKSPASHICSLFVCLIFLIDSRRSFMCVCVCVRACERACMRACVRTCVRDVFAIYDNNILPRLIMIIIKIIFLYFIEIAHTDDFPSTGARLVAIML